ncbi:hypothetical protein [Embleya scabrispora]|uniref:hypothetical protein n=1 Tax=Embleya scabrispora TaxID=159449 RepID=UPI00037B5318|nr:hypothetical protein [Embleya scabrispora]MYS86401.1 hypothetical protein [Streptomyces sp. SID5474]
MSRVQVANKALLVGLLFEGAAVGDFGRVRHRIGDDVIGALLGDRKPAPSLRALAARDPDPWIRRTLAHNGTVLTPADLAALLEQPDPVVDRIVYAHPEATTWMRRVVLAPGRYTETPHPLTALHEELLGLPAAGEQPRGLGAAVVAERPDLVAHALRVCAGTLTPAEELRGLLSLSRHGGTDLLPEALRHVRPEVAALATGPVEATGAGEATGALDALAAAVAEAEGPVGLIAELRSGGHPSTWRREIDWAALRDEQRREPLPEAAAVLLAADPDCPEDLLVALYTTHPTTVGPVARPALAVLRAAIDTPKHPALARIAALTRDLAEPADLARILYEVAPARTAVAALVELPECAELRELSHRHLGAHADRWNTLRAVLPRHRDALPALLAGIEAGTVTGPPEQVGGPPPTLTKPFRHLLTCADADDLRELLPDLPDVLVRDLLSSGSLPRHVHEAAITSTDPRAWEAMARNVGLDIRELARLVAKQVPAVDAAAYLSMRSTPSLRRTIARRPALDPGLRSELLTHGDRRTLLPLLASGEPELAERALSFGCRKIAQQYAYVRVWERHGPDGVRALLDSTGTATAAQIRKRVEAALKAEDGLTDLRASGEPYDDPATLPHRFQTRTSRTTVRDLVHEPYAHDFPLLMAANREEPFAYEAIDDLIRHEDATDEDRARLRLMLVNAQRTYARRSIDTPPLEWLRSEPFNRDEDWVNGAVEHGLLDPARLVDVAHPAQAVVLSAHGLSPEAVLAPMRARLAELTREHLAGHTEALAVAVGLIDGFSGSLAELIVLAGQAAGPRPEAEELARADAAALEVARREAAETANSEQVSTPAATAGRAKAGRAAEFDRTSPLVAAHLLRTMAAGSDPELGPDSAPVPDDPSVLAALASVRIVDTPGYEFPSWLYEACFGSDSVQPRVALGRRVFDESVANDLIDLGEPEVLAAMAENKDLEEPTRDRLASILAGTPAERPERYPTKDTWPGPSRPGSYLRWIGEYFHEKRDGGDFLAEGAYRHGFVGPIDVLGVLPARALTPLPRRWRSRIVAGPLNRAVEALVAERLGVDPERWLAALIAMDSAGDRSLPELLDAAARSGADGDGDWQRVESPITIEFAAAHANTWRIRRGWRWPAGDLLLRASPEALTVVLPRLGEHAYPTLWAYARHAEHASRAMDEYPFLANDRAALRIMAAWRRDADVRARLLRLDDPELNADLYGTPLVREGVAVRRAVLSRVPRGRPASGPTDLLPLDPALRERLLVDHRATGSVLPALRIKVEAADPELIEHTLRQLGKKGSLLDRLLGLRGLLRYGGAARIGELVEQGVLGATAGRVVVKALATADPDAALTERIDRERAGDKLVAKLRRCFGTTDTDEVLDLPYLRDWDLIVAEHEREPFPAEVLNRLVLQPDSPARLLELGPVYYRVALNAASLDAEHARASVAFGNNTLGDAVWYITLDNLVTAGLLTGHDLVHVARGAGSVLRWIAEAAHRIDVEPPIRAAATEARAEIAALLETRLGTDPTAWAPVFAALAGCDPTWSPEAPGSTVAALLTR